MRLLALALALLLAGCKGTGSSNYMTEDATPDPVAATADKALIIFGRRKDSAHGQPFSILDEKGEYIGQIPANGHIKHLADPGQRRYIVWAENTAVLDAEVAAGKIYYVEVVTRMGMWSARSHLLAVKKGSEDWNEAPAWVEQSKEWDVDPALAGQWKEDKAAGIPKQLQRAKEMWAKYDAEEKEERTLRISDGR